MKKFFAFVFCFLVIGIFSLATQAEAREPLLQEGKKTLYQRAVSHPNAVLYAAATGDAAVNPAVKTFTVYYIYGYQGERVEVGVNSNKADGFLDKVALTMWPQAITMVFTDRMGRMPVLFFKEHASLVDVCTSPNLGQVVKTLEEQAVKGTADPNFPVLAMEPQATAVAKNRFYLMPVLEMDDQFGEATKLLRVASIDPGSPPQAAAQNSASKELRTGLVFVIDTTISMKPYIEQTLALVREIYDSLEKNPHGDKVGIAIVAFRSSTDLSPQLEYTSKVVSDFTTVKNRKEIEKALEELDEAKASSHAFNEDSFAGVKTAVEKLSWGNYGSRVMLLISDAGPLASSDKGSSTKMDAKELADYLRSNNIFLTSLHLKTQSSKNNVAYAEKAYMELSRMADNTSSYIAIDATDKNKSLKQFQEVGKILANTYTKLVTATAEGLFMEKPTAISNAQDPYALAQHIGQATGYAMQLEFLGQKEETRAPGVVSAWIADADLEKLSQNTLAAPVLAAEPAVLLTKNQLSDLSKQLLLIIDNAERTKRTDSRDFFEGILFASAQLSNDPNRFSQQPGANLGQLGVLGEFLEGLPYKSDILMLTEEDWYNMSVGEQTNFINRLKSRIARYEEYDKDRANWESFGATNPGDWVYRVPLSALP